MLKEVRIIAIIAIILLSTSCQEDEDNINALLGIWIKSPDRSDTLIFEEAHFVLNRGKEERNGRLLPKYGSGLYFYELEKDMVSLRNSVSSSFISHSVFIEINSDKLTIGDFYQRDTANNQLLYFERLQ